MTQVDSSQFSKTTSPLIWPPAPVTNDPARLITSPDQLQSLTYVCAADARTSLLRGLAEYLGGMTIDWIGGRQLSFANVSYIWQDTDVPAAFPALNVLANTESSYSDSSLAPEIAMAEDGSKRFVRKVSELQQQIELHIWATDDVARSGLTYMLETALSPNEWMYGLRLALPYYYGAHCTYEPTHVSFQDSVENATLRWRRTIIQLTGVVPQYVPWGNLPAFKPSTNVAAG